MKNKEGTFFHLNSGWVGPGGGHFLALVFSSPYNMIRLKEETGRTSGSVYFATHLIREAVKLMDGTV